MIAEIIAALLRINLAAGAAILLVLALRPAVRRQFGPRVAYALWPAVPLAAAAVVAPKPAGMASLSGFPMSGATDHWFILPALRGPAAPAAAPPFDIAPLLLTAWLVGAVVALALTFAAHRRAVASFGILAPSPEDPRRLRASQEGLGPALIGIFRPRLVLPADFETRFDPREQALVLAHEDRHLARGDTRINTLIVLFSCLNWFNPLIHIAAYYARVDQELACDAAVVERFPGERRSYAEALLKTQQATAPIPLGCYWPGGSSNLLKERIAMLAQKKPGPRRLIAGAALVAVFGLAAGWAAWSAQPSETPLEANAVDSRRLTWGSLSGSPSDLSAAIEAGDLRRAYALGGAAQDIAATLQARGNKIDVPTAVFVNGEGRVGLAYSAGDAFRATVFPMDLRRAAPPPGAEQVPFPKAIARHNVFGGNPVLVERVEPSSDEPSSD